MSDWRRWAMCAMLSLALFVTSAHAGEGLRVLIVGGGSSHDFATSFGRTDVATLRAAGDAVAYTESFAGLSARLRRVDTVVQASNQAVPDAETRRALMEFVARGGGLVIVHAGTWYNWPEWPEYNRVLVGGGTRDHDQLGRFEVTVVEPRSPVMAGVRETFAVDDELYHQEMAPGASTEVLATAHSEMTGETYPSVWVVTGQKGRIVCMTLGHDERVHEAPAYKAMLRNAVAWTAVAPPRAAKDSGTGGTLLSPSLWKIDVGAFWSSDDGSLSADKTHCACKSFCRGIEISERLTTKEGRVDELGRWVSRIRRHPCWGMTGCGEDAAGWVVSIRAGEWRGWNRGG